MEGPNAHPCPDPRPPRIVFAMGYDEMPERYLASELCYVWNPSTGSYILPILDMMRNIRISVPVPAAPLPNNFPRMPALTQELAVHLSVRVWFQHGGLTIRLYDQKGGCISLERSFIVSFGLGLHMCHRFDSALGCTILTGIGIEVPFLKQLKDRINEAFGRMSYDFMQPFCSSSSSAPLSLRRRLFFGATLHQDVHPYRHLASPTSLRSSTELVSPSSTPPKCLKRKRAILINQEGGEEEEEEDETIHEASPNKRCCTLATHRQQQHSSPSLPSV